MAINKASYDYIKSNFPTKKHATDYIAELTQFAAAASGPTRIPSF